VTQYLTASVRELGIGTYCGEDTLEPIATATLQTTVFDVVHMFSERGISAVPIIDDNGKVVNLYETVDVIVRLVKTELTLDPGSTWRVPVTRSHHRSSTQATKSRLYWCCDVLAERFTQRSFLVDPDATST
jgi:Mg/Co/Ni transporter MgtE